MTTALHPKIALALLLALVPACPWDDWDWLCDHAGFDHPHCDDRDANDSDNAQAVCGDGVVDEGEQCDLGPSNSDEGECTLACQLAFCGDGLVHAGVEQCDDGEQSSSCTDSCTHAACIWDVEALSWPIEVWPGQAVLGEIAFDGDCNLIVGGGEELPYAEGLYRVDKDDGSVSVLVAAQDLPLDSLVVSGISYRASDQHIYFTVNIADAPADMLFAVDAYDQLYPVLELDKFVYSLTVAPASFGSYGDQLIGVAGSSLLAIDVDNGVISQFASSDKAISVAAFASDGTLYVAEHGNDRISTVTPNGTFTSFYTGLDAPEGLAISADGSKLLVAYLQGWQGHIDQISIPGGTLTAGVQFELSTGVFPTGIVIDGANHVLYQMPANNHASIGTFDVP